MDQPGFPPLWDEDEQQQLPQGGRAIDTSYPEQDFRYGGQPRAPVLNPGPGQPHATFPLQQQALPQFLERQSHFNLSQSYPQAFFSQNHTLHSALSSILSHPDVRAHRDSICFYLRLPPILYAELYRSQTPLPVHQELTTFLSQQHGELPADLWALIDLLREQPDFQQAQAYVIDVITTQVPRQNPAHTPGGSSVRGGPALGLSRATSPIQFHISSPVPGQGQTTASTPLSTTNPRSKSQSPFHRTKGRAPRGERYKCPYTNCKHEPFRNAGNFNNHMRSAHFESPYRNQHPSNFLIPEASPQPSIQGDAPSSSATTASDSPVAYRRQSQDYGSADLAAAFGRDRFANIGESAYPSTIDDEFQASIAPGATTEDSGQSLPHFSPEEAGHVGFGEFQRLEEQLWDQRRKK
ncbi:hypothetical protein H2200_007551 [Cladophialophora chaetospira]|uniref:Uncharacterized protein n=1 Tax=Cladophialophora chaetospira TaxID=386627 RepID=A0AA38X639_9EURO|nr:hypothetical protein H2200_007551 [Cladophialophora chaetospira]